ncbi:hypothetical protein [Microbacterium testaceum]|uniref:hypothetical protein n=1 Tax=Microbacterium testaceum TaxID=2033 RepID=UPI001245402C|nr:hypothetical protein [Microbacterium testaceum]
MREISYAGGHFTTTDEVADALLKLAVGLARVGTSEQVEVPITRGHDAHGVAWLMVGLGSSILSMPCDWSGAEPDFSGQATMMQMHDLYPRAATTWIQGPSAEGDASANQWDDYYGL